MAKTNRNTGVIVSALSLRDYVRLSAPEPEVLKAIGQESGGEGHGQAQLAANR